MNLVVLWDHTAQRPLAGCSGLAWTHAKLKFIIFYTLIFSSLSSGAICWYKWMNKMFRYGKYDGSNSWKLYGNRCLFTSAVAKPESVPASGVWYIWMKHVIAAVLALFLTNCVTNQDMCNEQLNGRVWRLFMVEVLFFSDILPYTWTWCVYCEKMVTSQPHVLPKLLEKTNEIQYFPMYDACSFTAEPKE